jgi:hypothetical protein
MMMPNHRRALRLKGYDYAQAGAYFVTICEGGHEGRLYVTKIEMVRHRARS